MICTHFKHIKNQYIQSHEDAGRVREVGPYYYSSNQGKGKKERSPGEVALWIQRLAQEKGFNGIERGKNTMRACSWCGNYPRTISSALVEYDGEKLFWEMVEFLEKEGTLKNGTE